MQDRLHEMIDNDNKIFDESSAFQEIKEEKKEKVSISDFLNKPAIEDIEDISIDDHSKATQLNTKLEYGASYDLSLYFNEDLIGLSVYNNDKYIGKVEYIMKNKTYNIWYFNIQ